MAKVYPELVQYTPLGQPNAVMYHVLNAMLLNEVQKQQRMILLEQQKNTLQAEQIRVEQQKNVFQAQQIRVEQQRNSLQAQQIAELSARLSRLEAQSVGRRHLRPPR